jgi:hypothetical protein
MSHVVSAMALARALYAIETLDVGATEAALKFSSENSPPDMEKSIDFSRRALKILADAQRQLSDLGPARSGKPVSVDQADARAGEAVISGDDWPPFDRAAQALDMLSDETVVTLGPAVWAELSIEERTELDQRATKRGQRLSNARAEGE